MRNTYILIFTLLLSGLGLAPVLAAPGHNIKPESEAPHSIFEHLSGQEVLEFTIKTDIGKLLDKESGKYQLGYMKLTDSASSDEAWKVELRARGKFRKRVCDFPPVKMKFDHSILGPENLKAYKTLKLVTHCGDEAEAEDLLLKEYLAYKIYNTITDESFRVQLAKITWLDSSGEHEVGEKWGFFIEQKDEVAHRLGGEVYDEFGVTSEDINKSSAALNSVFQYMIGNADWNLQMNKNIRFVKSNTSKDIKILPYDFDFSGLVNAPYAVSNHGQSSIEERIYLGESNPHDIDAAKEHIKTKEQEIMELVDDFEYLRRSERKKVKKYLQSFYQSIDEPFRTQDYYQERMLVSKKEVKNAGT